MARTKQEQFDYMYQRNLKKVKKYNFFGQIIKIKNKAAATIFAENKYLKMLDILDEVEKLDLDEEDVKPEDAKRMLELQLEVYNTIQSALGALIGPDNANLIFDYENEDGAGLELEDLISIFSEIYTIAKGGNPGGENFRNENKKQ